MKFTLDYLYDHIRYDLIIDGITYHGTIDYVTSHLGHGNNITFNISDSQEKELQSFVNEFLIATETEPKLTLEEFYNRKAI